MKTKMLLLIVFVCSYCGFMSAQTLPAIDSVVVIMTDGTVHKLDKAKKEDKAASDSIFKNQKDNIKQCYSKDEIGIYYIMPDVMPEFKGGPEALLSYLNRKLKYPIHAQANNIQETIYVNFIIDETGHVGYAKVVRGDNKLLCDEALRVVTLLPRWNPGTVDGRAVRVAYILPIRFSLQ